MVCVTDKVVLAYRLTVVLDCNWPWMVTVYVPGIVPEVTSVGARHDAASAKSSARIKLKAATRTPSHVDPNHPMRARRLLPNAREASAARLRSPRIKGGSLPLGKRGGACVAGGEYLAVLMDSVTLAGVTPSVEGAEVGLKEQVVSSMGGLKV